MDNVAPMSSQEDYFEANNDNDNSNSAATMFFATASPAATAGTPTNSNDTWATPTTMTSPFAPVQSNNDHQQQATSWFHQTSSSMFSAPLNPISFVQDDRSKAVSRKRGASSPPLTESSELSRVSQQFKRIRLPRRGAVDVRLSVLTLTGKRMLITVDDRLTVAELKEIIEEKEGIPTANQRLVYQGKHLNDDKNLHEYAVVDNSKIYLVLALRGGKYQCK